MKDLKNYNFLLGEWSPEAKRMFWDGFWSAFRHPMMIYGLGFTAGFVVRGLIGA